MTRRASGRPIVLALITALAISILPRSGVQLARAASELFFSEYIEGSSFNKALEIYNGTGSAVDLGASGYSVQMFFNGSTDATLTLNLVGIVADGDVFVLAQTTANAAILAQADQLNGAGWFNGDDAVVLRHGTTVIDAFGQVGFDPGTEWVGGLVSTADNTLRRKGTVLTGDPNATNTFDPSVEWDVYSVDVFDGLGTHTVTEGDSAPAMTSTIPADGAVNVPVDGNISVTFSEAVSATAASFTISCDVSGAHAAAITGGPVTFALDPAVDFAPGDVCTVTVVAANVTDQDAVDPPDNPLADASFGFSVVAANPCESPFTPIYTIQGSGAATTIPGNVTTQGVVVGDFDGPQSAGIQGFYLQDAGGDGNAATSDGIFVFTGDATPVSAGEVVRVTGFARERFNQTAINGSNSNNSPTTDILVCGEAAAPAPVNVSLPVTAISDFEPYEGMLVRFQQSLVIAEYFNYDRFGEVVLALPLDGEDRPFTGTAIDTPGAAANARTLANSLRRITLDDSIAAQNPPVLRHPNGDAFSLDNMFRGGDAVANAEGVLGFDFSLYRIFPTTGADHTSVNPRPAVPEDVGGTLRASAMNTLNFFLTADAIQDDLPATNNPADDVCGGNANLECRGHDLNQPTEFQRQRHKLLAALAGLDADIIGLNELENTPGVEPLLDPAVGIVAGLNAMPGIVGTYAAIDTGVIGTDAIRVGLIYRSDKVMPVGPHKILNTAVDPRFIDTRSRPVLAQTFKEIATGAKITVAVNHLKSKGSTCATTDPTQFNDPDAGDGQGNCNGTRTLAAAALVDWLETDPTGSGDRDFLILGDLNSYAREDPIETIKAGSDGVVGTHDDYTNLIARYQGTYAHSFVFDGQAGYLDHALASGTLAGQVTGAADWHINSDEPDVVDYDTSFKPGAQEALYEANPYRSSDHDPVVVGLRLLAYDFSGYFSPVDNPPVVNNVKAGQSVPVKFSLGADLGLDVFFGTPMVSLLTCASGAPTNDVDPTETPGGSGLTYDPATDIYTYVWKTEKGWLGQCRTLALTFDDGTYRLARFNFRP